MRPPLLQPRRAAPLPPPLGPGGMGPHGWRVVALLLAVLAAGATTVVMLADRAPGLLKRVSARIDAGAPRPARVASERALPGSDFEVHVLAWLVVAVLLGLAAWSWRSLAVSAAGLFAYTLVVEFLQEVLTATRRVEAGDVAGNALGIVLGTAVVAAATWGWSLLRR